MIQTIANLCDFEALSYAEGFFVHRCRRCGTRRKVRSGKVVRECNVPEPASAVVLWRIGICHRCQQRPAGCWKAVEYGCQIEYAKAARRVAETGNCPLKKLGIDPATEK